MPIYEFDCRLCHKRFELLIGISRVDEAACPTCGSKDVRRVMSSFASRASGGDCCDNGTGCAGCSSGNCADCSGH
ncbi:MAG: zinc ribbon domain-containing protein [Armatimonadetes bacterium]|jgi:putative FmdB family regulatory protein|nr:zinc ribbon domain-containing protein [Armatimonadota bacterium]